MTYRKHLKFDLDVKDKKYDLAQFVRDKLLSASDASAVTSTASSRSSMGYRRAQQALVR